MLQYKWTGHVYKNTRICASLSQHHSTFKKLVNGNLISQILRWKVHDKYSFFPSYNQMYFLKCFFSIFNKTDCFCLFIFLMGVIKANSLLYQIFAVWEGRLKTCHKLSKDQKWKNHGDIDKGLQLNTQSKIKIPGLQISCCCWGTLRELSFLWQPYLHESRLTSGATDSDIKLSIKFKKLLIC